ncbi:uncharacterized protein ARMOST_22450 [Armillaria ostoyae]|uniref:CCHC-type domain-containing protein n=1 Tax=Armillaria ostoyae TaxID=47428 RepID=A0A284SCW4_ARMOS|nr:uncharacterized protein ARMOST_22450 [Armillaria ostoyae]
MPITFKFALRSELILAANPNSSSFHENSNLQESTAHLAPSTASSSTAATDVPLPKSPRSPIPGSFIESPGSPYPEELNISTSENFQFSEPEDAEETEVTAELFGSSYGTAPGTPYSGHAFGGYHIENTSFTDYRGKESVVSSDELLPDIATTINFDIKDESFEQSVPLEPPNEQSTSYFPLVPILPPVFTNPPPVPAPPVPLPQPAPPVPPVQPPVQPAIMAATNMPFRKEKSAPNIIDEVSPGCELTRYISDIEGLFSRHSITQDADKKKWFIYYPGLTISEFWESLPEYADAIIAQYPDASASRKYERHDLERVIGKYAREIDNLADLGAFYREFFPKAKHLVTEGRLSTHETGNMFSKGFPNHVWDAIARRLQIKLPDHHPADPYNLADIYAAAQFVLQGTNKGESTISGISSRSSYRDIGAAPARPSEIPYPVPVPQLQPTVRIKEEPVEPQVKMEHINQLIKLGETLLQLNSNDRFQKAQQRFQPGPPPQSSYANASTGQSCSFCGEIGHFIRECLRVKEMIKEGKCRRNIDGKIVLSTGAWVPRNIQGTWLKDRIEEWHCQNPGQTGIVNQMMNAIVEPVPYLSQQRSSPVNSDAEPQLLSTPVSGIDARQRLEALIAKSEAIGKEIQGIKQFMHMAEEDSSSPIAADATDTMLRQVVVEVPRLKRGPLKRAVPAARAEPAVPQEPTKAVGRQTRTSRKAAEEAVLEDEQEVAVPKIRDHFDQDLTPDYDDMPGLVEDSDDEEDYTVPPQTKKDDDIAAAVIESYAPRQFEKAKTIVHDNGKNITSKFPSYAPPVTPRHDQSKSVAAVPEPAPAKERVPQLIPEDIHPFAAARPANYAPPAVRNAGAKPDVRKRPKDNEPAYRTRAPIEGSHVAREVYERALDSTITLSHQELYSLSPAIREMIKEDNTKRKVPNTVEQFQKEVALPFTGPETVEITVKSPENEEDGKTSTLLYSMPTGFIQTFEQTSSNRPRQEPPEGSSVVPDPYEARLKKGEKIGPLKCAADSISLRSIVPVVDHQLKVECIIDPGSQVISMSEAVCLRLGLIYDPTVILEMQSANGTTNYSLGLARNVAFLFGDITLYLQVHIIRQSAYDILLGRPFDTLTQSIVRNYADENQTITIHDPNTGKTATIPTIPRGRPQEIALVIELDANQEPKIIAYAASQIEFDSEKASTQYLSACDPNKFPIQPTTFTQSLWSTETVYSSTPYTEFSLPTDREQLLPLYSVPTQIPQDLSDFCSVSQPRDYMYRLYGSNIIGDQSYEPWFSKKVSVFAGKKYKPVALKTKPVLATLSDKFRIIRNIRGDPLADIPTLSPTPPPFVPTKRYTQERKEYIDSIHNDGFLWSEEMKLMHHFMTVQEKAFAWEDSERGSFRKDFFPPIDIPVVEHTPWVLRNIPIPPGIYAEVCRMIKTKIDAGVYEPSNSSYRSRWFTVLKKDGKSLRIVHSLEPLNEVTIAHSGLPPTTDPLAEHFAGRACGATLDLFVGYDERLLAESSRDLTTFQTPYGALRLITLPMGWTNSVPIFHNDVTFILQPEIPEFTIPYIDDVPV